MNFIFIVQGEGRGHMTQAISLFNILTNNGHSVSHVIVGKSKRRELPSFFVDKISAPITQLESPNFVTDRHNKSVSVFKTLFVNLFRVRTYLKSIRQIDSIVKNEAPDTVINFYDFLGGLFFILKRPKANHVAVAHQFLLNHTAFEFPKGRIYDRHSILNGNKLAGFKAKQLLCLSFSEMPNEPDKKIVVVPPLLRDLIRNTRATKGDHFLAYMVNHGYSTQVEAFHKKHPDIPVHCFWDKKDAPTELKVDNTLTFHRLDDKKFIQFMASCKGYLTTAGFESVCEAMYLGKPVLMVPVEGHYEQACNALDATKAGAGISSDAFDLELLLDYIPTHKDVSEGFRKWCSQSEKLFLEILTKESTTNGDH